MLAIMGGMREREQVSLDFLALGRSFGLSVWQAQKLWERLTDDPRYHLASDPERWLATAFRQEATAIGSTERAHDHPQSNQGARSTPYGDGAGKQSLVEKSQTLWPRRATGTRPPKPDVAIGNAPVAGELPFRAEVEELLGANLDDVRAYTHQDALLSPHGARAAAFRGGIAFAGIPTKDVVVHEAVHTLQLKTRGTTRDAAAAEAQAEHAARAVAQGARRIALSYVPTAAVSFDKGSGPPAGSTNSKPLKQQRRNEALGGYEALLLEALTRGDAPVPEFQNYARQMEEQELRELLQRLSVIPPPANDRLATAFYQTVPQADRTRITSWLAQTVKSYTDDRLWAELAPGESSVSIQLISRVDAPKGVYLRSHPAGGKDGALLPFGTLVAASRKTEKGWYYVTVIPDHFVEGAEPNPVPAGSSGFVESYHVASAMPEPTARLHKVTTGEYLKDIAARYYGHGFAWGHDARVFVQAIYHANKDRDAVFRRKADLTVNQEALNTKSLDRALELWAQARVVSGQALWMPSHEFVNQLKAAGLIHQASISMMLWNSTVGALADAWDFVKYAAGFAIGILEGAWGALEDLFTGVVDLVKMVWTVLKDIFSNFSEIKALAKKISEAWKNRDALIQELATDFMDRWQHPGDYTRGNFHGEFLGYVMTMAFITLVTFGAGAAVVGAGRFGAFIRLIQFADKVGSLGTYVSKLKNTVRLPKHLVERSRQALGKTTHVSAGGDPPKGHAPEVDSPHASPAHIDKPHAPDAPHVDVPHVHRPPQQNRGAPYIDPTSDHPEAGTAPRAHLDKLIKVDPPEVDFKKVTKAIKKGAKGIPVGRKLKDVAEGHDLLRRLSQGDVLALDDLGLKNVPRDFHVAGREWALVEGKNGFYIYAGRYADLELPAGTRIHAHNHPDPRSSAPLGNKQPTIDLPVSYEGKTFPELIDGGAGSRTLLQSGLSPSIADIHAISDGSAHVIYTRFVHRGNGKIANPVAGELASPVEIRLAGAKVLRYNPRNLQYYYQVSVELRDATGKKLWSGEMYGNWYAVPRQGDVHHIRPRDLDGPLPSGWVQP